MSSRQTIIIELVRLVLTCESALTVGHYDVGGRVIMTSCVVFFPALFSVVLACSSWINVVTKSGTVTGCWKTSESLSWSSFLGVPYAEPPIGELRFQLPVPVPGWDTPRQATRSKRSCLRNPGE